MTNLFYGCAKDDEGENAKGADLVVYGEIFTAEESGYLMAEAFVVDGGKFVYVGSKEGAAAYVVEGTKVVDYRGKGLIIPGCTEGHGHFFGIDAIARKLPGYLSSYANLVGSVIPQKMETNPGPFFAFGWAVEEVEKYGTRDYASEIEAVSKGYPVVLMDGNAHNAICNRTALRIAGLINEQGEKIKEMRGGELDASGNATQIANGYITDEMVFYVAEKTMGPLLDEAGYRQACQDAVRLLNERGFTNYLDAYMNALDNGETYQYISDLDRSGQLTINMIGYYTIRSCDWGYPQGGTLPQEVRDKLDYVESLGRRYSSRHVAANGVKLFADGVVELATGWISQEYTQEGLPAERRHGNKIWEQGELDQIVAAANAEGMPVHTHTFGDLACNAVINAYSASPTAPRLTVRNSLAHVRNISNVDIVRCSQNNIGIASNLIWHAGDPEYVRNYFYSIMPGEVYESGYPMKSLIEAGVVVSSSTDAPCGESLIGTVPNIIGVSVNGLVPEYPNEQPLNPRELLTVREVLQCLTINGASNVGLEQERGSIKVGKYADFVVLDQDVLELEARNRKMEIFNTNVKSTWFEGKRVYGGE